MKKLFSVMTILLALGMVFIGCEQPKDETKTESFRKATAADFEGDLSWMKGTWKASYEVEGCTAEQKEQFINLYKTAYPDKTCTTDDDAKAMAAFMKTIISTCENLPSGSTGQVSINDSKTKIKIGEEWGSCKNYVNYTKQ